MNSLDSVESVEKITNALIVSLLLLGMAYKVTTQSSMHSTSTKLLHLLVQSSWILCTQNYLGFLFSSCLRVTGSTTNLYSGSGRELNVFTSRNFRKLSAPWSGTVQTETRDAGRRCYSLRRTTLEAGFALFLRNLALYFPVARLKWRTGISSETHVVRTIYITTRSFSIHLTTLPVCWRWEKLITWSTWITCSWCTKCSLFQTMVLV